MPRPVRNVESGQYSTINVPKQKENVEMWKCGPLEIAANVGATRLNDFVPYSRQCQV